MFVGEIIVLLYSMIWCITYCSPEKKQNWKGERETSCWQINTIMVCHEFVSCLRYSLDTYVHKCMLIVMYLSFKQKMKRNGGEREGWCLWNDHWFVSCLSFPSGTIKVYLKHIKILAFTKIATRKHSDTLKSIQWKHSGTLFKVLNTWN